MEPLHEALRLMQRPAELEEQMRQPGGIHINEERELFALRRALQTYPTATRTILEAAQRLRRPVDTLSVSDIENLAATF